MNFSKKGLSDIITNVLIILLVLVAVGIIWAFVRPTINQGAGGLQGASDCLTIQVEPVSCSSNQLVVKRGVGAGNLAGLKLIVETSAGETTTSDIVGVQGQPGELATVTLPVNANVGDMVSVAALVEGADGTRTCPANPVVVTCTS